MGIIGDSDFVEHIRQASLGKDFYGRAGLVFGAVLYIACGKSRKAKTINDLLKHYAETPIFFSWKGHGNAGTSMYEEILKSLDQFEA
ncbi:MAG: hypothetical protein LC657_16605, partial [Desulfobacteraceae bacterium]|nr:hypothetical protein [Desulfobacteraceae bacterium]